MRKQATVCIRHCSTPLQSTALDNDRPRLIAGTRRGIPQTAYGVTRRDLALALLLPSKESGDGNGDHECSDDAAPAHRLAPNLSFHAGKAFGRGSAVAS